MTVSILFYKEIQVVLFRTFIFNYVYIRNRVPRSHIGAALVRSG